MSVFIINFLLFFLPLVIFPLGTSQFETPKVILAVIFIEILVITALIKQFREKIYSINRILRSIIILLFLLTLYHLIFLYTPLSFLGNRFRWQGIFLLWHLTVFSVLSSFISYKGLSFYWYAIVLAMVFVSSIFLGNSDVGRSIGTLGEPNSLAAFVIFLWPFAFFAPDIASKYRKYFQISCIILVLSIIFLSGSRSGLIAFFIQGVFYFTQKTGKNLRFSLIAGLILVGATYILPFFNQSTYENRSVIWHTALAAGLINPVTGGGFGNTELLLRSVVLKEHNSLIGYYVDSSHNIFLDWWVQGGLIGVGIITTLLILVIKNFYVRKSAYELMLLLGLLTVFSLNPLSVVSLLHFWWLIGQGFKQNKIDSMLSLGYNHYLLLHK